MNIEELINRFPLNGRAFSVVYTKWEEIEEELAMHFRNRDLKKAEAPMMEALALFIQSLFFIHGQSSPATKDKVLALSKNLSHRPINIDERLNYILNKPIHYLSFVQLKELFAELKKKEAVLQLKRKR